MDNLKQGFQIAEMFESGSTFTTKSGTCFCTCYVRALTDSTTVGNRSASNSGDSLLFSDLSFVASVGLTGKK